MTPEQRAVNTIKCLGMDAVQQANSGHPGMVMGMAEMVMEAEENDDTVDKSN